jgi:uncharacterized protein YbbC (DUF1343 family)
MDSVNNMTMRLNAILNTEIFTTGRDALDEFRSPFIILRAMKYAVFTFSIPLLRKYAKLWAIGSFFLIFAASCVAQTGSNDLKSPQQGVLPGIYDTDKYLPLLEGKRVGVVGNQTSRFDATHLVDSLISLGIQVKKVFSPEHGFRGVADAGEKVQSDVDAKTGLPIISLYGKNKKPTPEQLEGLDMILFDLQDVGVRFYTYISTLHYVMEACAEANIPLVVLDRPNPNADYIDGPIRQEAQKSFIGMHPVPIVYGMTIGEYGLMINGEQWIAQPCALQVILIRNYDHQTPYDLPVAPSPNLRTANAVAWYPSLCFFEGTTVSVGRGTDFPFEVAGHPDFKGGDFSFTPKPSLGAKDPLHNGKVCNGYDYRNQVAPRKLSLEPIIVFYRELKHHSQPYFLKNNFFNLLAGNTELRKQIESGMTEEDIRKTWEADLEAFQKIRKKYLLYQ